MDCIHVMHASYGYINETSNACSVDKFSSFVNKGSKGVDCFFWDFDAFLWFLFVGI